MYENKKQNKKELVTAICKRLNEKGFEDCDAFGRVTEYSAESSFGRSLSFLPVDNLAKIAELPIEDYESFNAIYQAWGKSGALRFTPYEVDPRDNPSLVIRHNRFLHMFRGYHFQASATVDGIGDCGSGSYRTDFLVRARYNQRIHKYGVITYLLWWAALIDVGFRFDNFVEAFYSDKSVIEKFLSDSTAFWSRRTDFKWKDVEPYIKIGTGHIDINNRKMYQLRDKGIDAYLAIGKKTIQVETADKLVTIYVPSFNEGGIYDLYDEDDLYDYEDEVSEFEGNHYLEILAVMAFKLAGIHISFINYYPIVKHLGTLRPINSPDVINVSSLNDIYNAIPDEF